MKSNKHHFSTDAEQSVLGAMVLDPNRIGDILGTINLKHFFHRQHKIIFSAIRTLSENTAVIDLITINDYLERTDEIESVGGFAYLADVVKNCPSAANVMAYCDILTERWIAKRTDEIKDEYDKSDELSLSWLVENLAELDRSKREDFKISWGSDGFDNEVDYLVDGVIPEESFGITYGPSESFKSFLAIDQACCISTGLPWDGHETKKGLVVYVAGEGQTGVAKRIKAWEEKTGLKANVAVIGHPVYMNEDGQPQKLVKIIQRVQAERGESVRMVVLDTLARCLTGDENSAQDMGAFIKGCDYVKVEAGVTINVIHHSGKDKDKGARGSSSLRGACDFEYRVDRPNPDELAMIIKCTKMKDSERLKDVEFEMQEFDLGIKDKRGKPVTSLALSVASIEPKLRNKSGTEKKKTKVEQQAAFVVEAVARRYQGAAVSVSFIKDDFNKMCADAEIVIGASCWNKARNKAIDWGAIQVGNRGFLEPTGPEWLDYRSGEN